MGVAERRRLVAQPGGLMLGFALHLVCVGSAVEPKQPTNLLGLHLHEHVVLLLQKHHVLLLQLLLLLRDLGQLRLGGLVVLGHLAHLVLGLGLRQQRLDSRVQLPPLPVAHRQPAPDVALDHAQCHSIHTTHRA